MTGESRPKLIFGYNRWLPVMAAAIGAALPMLALLKPEEPGFSWVMLGMAPLVPAVSCLFLARVTLDEEALTIRFLLSLGRSCVIPWADIRQIEIVSKRAHGDHEDVHITLESGKLVAFSPLGTAKSEQLCQVFRAVGGSDRSWLNGSGLRGLLSSLA